MIMNKKGLSRYNVEVLANIRRNARSKDINFKVVDEINKKEFVLLATKGTTKEKQLLYIQSGKIAANLPM